jgi:hypothetical protein
MLLREHRVSISAQIIRTTLAAHEQFLLMEREWFVVSGQARLLAG